MSNVFWIFLTVVAADVLVPLVYFLILRHRTSGAYFSILASQKELTLPSILVVIPTFNESKTAEKKLQNTVALSYPRERLKLLFIDDGSTDDTVTIIRQFLNSHKELNAEILTKNKRKGKMDSIELMLQRRGECDLLSLTDCDVTVPPETLENAVKYLSNPSIGIVNALPMPSETLGASEITDQEIRYRSFYNVLRMGESTIHSSVIGEGGFMVCKSEILPSSVQTRSGGDDTYLVFECIKRNHRSISVPDCIFYEESASTSRARFRQKTRRGKHILHIFWENLRLLRDRSNFGKIIFPVELFLHMISPILLGAACLLYVLLIVSEPLPGLAFLLLLGALMIPKSFRELFVSFVTTQFALLLAAIELSIFRNRELFF